MSYFSHIYDPNTPLMERIGWATLFPIAAPLSLLSSCVEYDSEKAASYEPAADVVQDLPEEVDIVQPECVPEECDGLIDKSRRDGSNYLCISFGEVASKKGLVSQEAHAGIEIVDLNGDGYEDVYLLNNDAPNQFFLNKSGKFQESQNAYNLEIDGNSRAAAFGDYDEDGDLDLFLAGEFGSKLYVNSGDFFSEAADGVGIVDDDSGLAATWLGSNLYLATENGTKFYLYTGANFVESAEACGLYDPGSGSAFAVADFDGDGFDDVYLANSTGYNRLFKNVDSLGNYESVEDNQKVAAGYGQSMSAAWFKMQPNDALLSLYVANWDAANLLYVNDGKYFSNKAKDLGVQDPGFSTCAKWGDPLNEGFPALFLCRFDQMNLFYLPVFERLGMTKTVKSYQNVAYPANMAEPSQTVDAEWLDFDNDGKLDLIVAMADGGLKLYQNNTHWVKGCE